MEKSSLVDRLFTKKTQDYTYAIAFFLIFSFFLFFVIRPNLLSVFQANAEIDNLRKINNFYEVKIQKIIELQGLIETNRDDFKLLDEAITKMPQVNKILEEITGVVDKNKLSINKINIIDIDLKKPVNHQRNNLKTVSFDLEVEGNFENFINLLKDLYNQRRAKTVKKISISKIVSESTESASLVIDLQVDGYYL